MNQINIATKKFTDAVKINIGQLPVTDVKIDFNLTDGSNPVIAENKTFTMTIGSVEGKLYKTDDDTVSYRYLKFDDNNVADSLAITMKMNGEEILNDTVSLTYQTSGGGSSVTVDSEMSESSPNPVANSTLTPIINGKADKATTIAGYGITDAYTKTEMDAKVASVYHYKGTVSTYADLPSSGQEVGDVWNIETADSTHGIKAGDNVAWTGTEWDVLAGTVDLTPYATKDELSIVATTGSYNDLSNKPDLTTKLDAPAVAGTVGQVLTKTEDGQEWADPAGGGGVDADTMQAIEDLSNMLDGHTGISTDTTNYLRLVATKNNHIISIGATGFTGNVSLEYSIDKIHWFEFNPVTTVKSVALSAGQCMYLRGNNNSPVLATNGYSAFFGDYILDGDMKSLWSKTLEPEYTLTSCSYWFWNCGIVGFGNNFVTPDLSHVTTMGHMFGSAQSLTTLPSNFSIPNGVTDCSYMFYRCENLVIPVGFTIPDSVTNVQDMFAGCFIEEIPALPASVVKASWYASYGKGSSSPSRLAAGFKFPEGCTECSYALHDRCISSLPDGFTIPSTITDEGQAFKGNHPLTTVGNNVSFLKQNASWIKDYIPYNTITTIGDNFTLLCNNAPSTDPYVCFPNLTSLGTNCNINGTITNPA